LSPPADLIKAIRTGRLADVVAALDAGAPVEMYDGQGDPGLPLGIACFMGHAEIVRELVTRGARADLPDNQVATSPLSIAIRGGRTEVVKVLIELGAAVPPDMATGLSDEETAQARRKAEQHAVHAAQPAEPALNTPQPLDEVPVFEEIQMVSCYGTDTGVLDAEMIRLAVEMEKKRQEKNKQRR